MEKVVRTVCLPEASNEFLNSTKHLKIDSFEGDSYLTFFEDEFRYVTLFNKETNEELEAILVFAGKENGRVYKTVNGWIGGYKATKDEIVIKRYNGDAWIASSYRVMDYEECVKEGLVKEVHEHEELKE